MSERGLFHTEIQTPDRDLTTLPNLYLATNPVTVVRQSGTIISATVSLGYDVHHARIEKLLLEAAQEIKLEDPFVQIKELGDYSIVYRVAGLLTETKKLIRFQSRLKSEILDALHQGGVEIVSPQFNNARVLEPAKQFIPTSIRKNNAPAADSARVEVAFDKAEEAENIDSRRYHLKELLERLKDLQKEEKSATKEEKSILSHQITHLEQEIEDLKAELAQSVVQAKEDGDKTN